MQKLRSIHLYLGCLFAPLLLFFAISGIWQTLGLHSPVMDRLSTIHTEVRWKNPGGELGSFALRMFVIVMAASFVLTTILGIVMAVKYGRSRRAAYYCLLFGVVVPCVLVLVHLWK
jgi:hypothetical protein